MAWSITHWMIPVWSRRSTKARCSPCSRRRATQPHRRTVGPTSALRSTPHRWVRMAVGRFCSGLGRAGSVGRHGGGLGDLSLVGGRRAAPGRGRRVGARFGQEGLQLLHNGSPRDAALAGVAAQGPQADRPRRQLLGADHQCHQGARAVGRLDLGLHGAPVEGPVGPQAGPAQLGGEGHGGLAAGGVDDVGVQRIGRHTDSVVKTPSASQASSTRSTPMPNPMPGVGSPPSSSTRPS